jgi:hypothetical protein
MGLETFWFDGIALVNARATSIASECSLLSLVFSFYKHFLQIALAAPASSVVRAGPALCRSFDKVVVVADLRSGFG